MKMKFYIIIFLLIVGILAFFGMGYMHEEVHKAIFKDYGINSTISYWKGFPDFITTAEKPCADSNCILAHELNEIVGYPLLIIFSLVFLMFFFVILQIENTNELLREAIDNGN